MTQVDAWRMVRKRALAAASWAGRQPLFPSDRITAYLANWRTLSTHNPWAHESPRTTKLLRSDQGAAHQDEVERSGCDAEKQRMSM